MDLPPRIKIYAVLAGLVACGLLVLLTVVGRQRLKAVSLLDEDRRACERGDGLRCQRLGWEYEQGERVRLDPERALALYEKGCAARAASSCFFAGTLLEGRGRRTPAAALYARACSGGDAEGCAARQRLTRRAAPGVLLDPDCPAPEFLEALHAAAFHFEHGAAAEGHKQLRRAQWLAGAPLDPTAQQLLERLVSLARVDAGADQAGLVAEATRAAFLDWRCFPAELHQRFHLSLPPVP